MHVCICMNVCMYVCMCSMYIALVFYKGKRNCSGYNQPSSTTPLMRTLDKIDRPLKMRPQRIMRAAPCATEISTLFNCWRAIDVDAPGCIAAAAQLRLCMNARPSSSTSSASASSKATALSDISSAKGARRAASMTSMNIQAAKVAAEKVQGASTFIEESVGSKSKEFQASSSSSVCTNIMD